MRFMVNTKKDHSKFWIGQVTGPDSFGQYCVLAHYGRLGAKGSTQPKTFGDKFDAESHLLTKLREKINRGYRECSKAEYDRLAMRGALVGTANKLSDLLWVKRFVNGQSPVFKVITEAELADASIEPAIYASVELRIYGPANPVKLLFTAEKTYFAELMRNANGQFVHILAEAVDSTIDQPVRKIIEAVNDVIGQTILS